MAATATITTTAMMIMGSSLEDDCDNILPEDIVFCILIHLPVKSLLRFKSVCKSWSFLIQSSCFINQHLNHHHYLKYNDYNLLQFNPDYQFLGVRLPFTVTSITITGGNYEAISPIRLILDLPSFREFCDYAVDMVTCNGIICVQMHDLWCMSNTRLNVCLWNPATRQLRDLPQPPFSPPSLYNIIHPIISLGFGFDVKTNDYKVVRIFTFPTYHVNQVEVYSFNSDSWKTIKAVLPCDVVVSNPNAPYRSGTYCWLGRDSFAHPPQGSRFPDNFVFSFDFSEEVFQTMSLPDADSVKSDFCPQLTILKDNIACINKVKSENTFEGLDRFLAFEVWVLNTYGVKESWTKLYKVGPFLRPKPIGLSRNGKFLFLVRDQQLCMYNIVTQKIQNLSSQSISVIKVVEYKESLVSVAKGHGGAI